MMKKPLNAIQRRIFNFARLYKNDPSYNLTFLFVVDGPFDGERFLHIGTQVADSADIARCRIIMENSHHVIVHDEEKMNNVRFINWEHLTRTQFLEDIRKIGEAKLNTPIDITEPLRINLELYRNAADFHGIIAHFSHIIADAYGGIHFLSLVQDFYNSGLTYDEIATNLKGHSFGRFLSGDFPPITRPHSPDFFQKEFQGLPTLEMLKIKQSRNSAGVVEGEGCTFKIDPPLSKAIRDFVKTHEITEFPFFLAIYTILLARLSEQRDVVLGLPLANRTPANMNVFGCFVNTLPIRMTLVPDMTFLELYKLAFQKTFALMRHQGFDITTLDEGSRGFVNNVFTYYKQEIAFQFKDCSVERIPLKNKFLMFDFLGRVSSGECFTVNLEYGKPLADVDFMAVYHAIIEQALANKKLGDIQLYTDLSEEYAETNSFMGKTDGGKRPDDCANPDTFGQRHDHVVHVFQDIAEKYPDRTAIKFHQTEWSYKKLSDVSDGMARVVAEKFPQAERIALSCSKGPALVAVILGIIKSGKSYVPIDVNSPTRRIEYILADAGNIPYIIEDDILDMEHRLANVGSQGQPFPHWDQSLEPHTLANELYVIYTSGSTGEPKGVPVSSANLMSLLKATAVEFNFNEQDIWTLFHSYGFDFSVWEIFGCLLSGGKLVLVDGTTAKSPEQFYELVSRENVTVLNQTPTAFKGFMNADSNSRLPLSLRYIIFGGEKLNFSMLSPWLEQHEPDAPHLINMYGITETTVHVTFYKVTRNDILHNPRSIIGKPLNSLEVYIADQDLNILPKGLAGELLVCGHGVVNGYHNKDDITRDRFIYLPAIGQRAYRSGDIAKITTDGHLEYIGRMDNQVQLRGFRIELGEIENVILEEYQDYQVRACTVQMIEINGYDQLIAFIVSGCPLPGKKEIMQRLRSVLADYMVPLTYIQIDDMPITVNGKIDLAELKRKLPELNELPRDDVLPQADASIQNESFGNEQERYLFDIISRALNSKDFSLDDNFFDIGIMSIHIPDIYDSISATYKIDGFQMIDLFEYTTIRKLADLIRRKEGTEGQKTETNNRAALRRRGLESRGRGL